MNKIKNAKSDHTFLDHLLLWCIVAGAAFSKTNIVPNILAGISIADVLLMCGITILGVRLIMNGFRVVYSNFYIILLLFLFWSSFSGLCLNLASPFGFSGIEFTKSLLKLSFYGLSAVLFASYLRRLPSSFIGNAILNILTFFGLIAIYIFIVMTLKLNLPYEFFWYGHLESYLSNIYYRSTGFVVARGVFSEPSTLGIYLNLGLAFLFFWFPQLIKKNKWKITVIILPILLSFSLTAIFLLSIILFLFFIKTREYGILLPVIIIIVPIFVGTTLSTYFKQAILKRTYYRVLQGTDDSATGRIVASWEVPLKIINDSPFAGAGIGNLDVASLDMEYDLKYEEMRGKQTYNIFAYVLGTQGLIGFFLLILLVLKIKSKYATIVFTASMFASGNFLDPVFWIFYCLFTIPISIKRNQQNKLICRSH